ncbi:carboxypeptidase-like regulatory domain-containing protein [Aliifodinibius sp. S!AR15-10]|uniref:carboxypeptidase regulatory-like domain-containing protein n=1 Tax=Aliifodinibius sp. S!AR15-10 TaxID=2950437 RepID=UPI0028565C22|nr:carboxypeptidase regulatory-like domain-containing protein [Aliifodinibius sp. S!AR15-10]MDR8391896.1 carboxypeptidase-like regulatory domain-containing protein [Aliifodinibius sp. S!AR15-10]
MFNFKKLTRLTTFFALILGLGLSTAYAQDSNQNTETYKLTLKVVDAESGEALPNATIEILGIYEPNTTNPEGLLVFEEIETDPHTFKIYADGYETWTKTLTVTKESQLTVRLKPTG